MPISFYFPNEVTNNFQGIRIILAQKKWEKFLIINTREFATLQQGKTLSSSCVSLQAVDEPYRRVRNSLPAMFKWIANE